jgi:hypothetical protein
MHDAPERWHWTYDRAPLEGLPLEARNALMFPNDLLLKPSGIRSVTESLLDHGWHPRHIAGLIRSKFERDYSWGRQWVDYSPAMRADFYVRIFSSAKTSVAQEVARIRGREIGGEILPEAREMLAAEKQMELRL